jgi:hypothetical protein
MFYINQIPHKSTIDKPFYSDPQDYVVKGYVEEDYVAKELNE